MKKHLKLIVLLLTVCFYGSVNAQGLGVTAGLNVSSIDGSHMSNAIRWHLGFIGEAQLARNIYLQPGITFSAKGGRKDLVPGLSVKANYLEVPVTIMYKAPVRPESELQYFIQGGCYFAYGLYGKSKLYNADGWSITQKTFKDDFPNMRRFDAGLTIGAGIQIAKVAIGLRYQFGLVDTQLGETAYMFNPTEGLQLGDTRNRTLQVSITYMFKSY